jgi:hypothetical protein
MQRKDVYKKIIQFFIILAYLTKCIRKSTRFRHTLWEHIIIITILTINIAHR